MNGRSQTGLVCASSVDDYFNDVIKKHEFTRPEKEKDRIDHMLAIRAQTGNVFLAYRDVKELNALINDWKTSNIPVYDFIAADGIKHTIWIVDMEIAIRTITQLFKENVPLTYIADGHHRAASAAKVSKQLSDSADAKFFLTTIFPASQLAILDYNRVVKDLNGLTAEKLLGRLQEDFYITLSTEPVNPSQQHEFGMYLDGKWYILTSRPNTYTTDPIGVLDITILSNNVLKKFLDIKDQRTDKRIDFVGGIRGLKELEKRVDSGEMKVAFSLYPVTIEQLFDIADSGNVMPPKSTWFEPKLRDGLLTHFCNTGRFNSVSSFLIYSMKKILSLIAVLSVAFISFAQPDDPKTMHENARTFMRSGDYDNAILILIRALQQDTKNLEMQKDLVMSYYLKKDYVKALEGAEVLIERDDADVVSYQIAGNVYKALEMVKECDKMYKKALKKFPKSGPLHSEYGELLWAIKDFTAIEYWENGIKIDPGYSGNYYNAAMHYFYTKDKVWSLIYGEIFINMESLGERGAAMKQFLLQGYKEKLFNNPDLMKGEENNKSPFAISFLQSMNKQASQTSKGVTTETLTMIRTRFILDWYATNAVRYPFRLFDYHRQLISEGMFTAYNQWLFGASENLAAYENWTKANAEEYNGFNTFQRSRIFRMPQGQYYQVN